MAGPGRSLIPVCYNKKASRMGVLLSALPGSAVPFPMGTAGAPSPKAGGAAGWGQPRERLEGVG